MYHSQIGQDRFVDEYFNGKRDLTFVEFGALNGIDHSNTYFLEKERGWNGLCIEPNPIHFKELVKNRNCRCSNLGVTSVPGEFTFLSVDGYGTGLSGFIDFFDEYNLKRIASDVAEHGCKTEEIKVKTDTLTNILISNDIVTIDYMSVDIEGGEIDALKDFNFKWFDVKLVTIENNQNKDNIRDLMFEKGYYVYKNLEWDDVYVPIEFTRDMIKDKVSLDSEVETETMSIFNSDEANRSRPLDEIRNSVSQGKVAERFLIETGRFRPSQDRWHDLIDINGDLCEVKAYSVNDENAPSVQRDIERIKTEGWNRSKWYILFKYEDGKYTFLKRIKIR